MTTISNWSNYPVVDAAYSGFTSSDELVNKIKNSKEFILRGNGRCYGDSSLNDEIISCLNFDKMLKFDEESGVLEVQAGVLLDDILKVIVPSGWFLPVTPGTKFITIAGAIASDVHGKNHHIDGSISNHVLNIDLLLSDGSHLSVSPILNSDLFWATCGGMGLTGAILSVKFKLKRISSAYIDQTVIKAKNLNAALEIFGENEKVTYSVAWIDCLKGGDSFGRSLVMLGDHYIPDKQVKLKDPFKVHSEPKINIPFNLPNVVLNKLSIKSFNFLYYNKLLGSKKKSIDHYDGFFYPLDAILNWNRMYGKRGFAQYQFVLPLSERKGLEVILKKIQRSGMGSFLAVLKLFGEQNDLISFPMKGFTLALDFPLNSKLFKFLDELDKLVIDHGGRLYMTKDNRMKSDVFWDGYPRAKEFVSIIKKYNPEARINSLMAKRLEIL